MREIVGNQAVKLARVASGMNQSQAAELLDISLPTYAAREKLPRSFTVDELNVLLNGFSDEGKVLIRGFVRDIFLQ